MLFLKLNPGKNSAISPTLIACLKTKHQIVYLVFLIWVLLFLLLKKNISRTLLHLKTLEILFS